MKLLQKLLMAFGCVALLVVIVGIVSYVQISNMTAAMDETISDSRLLADMVEMQELTVSKQLAAMEMLKSTDKAELEEFYRQYTEGRVAFDELLKRCLDSELEEKIKKELELADETDEKELNPLIEEIHTTMLEKLDGKDVGRVLDELDKEADEKYNSLLEEIDMALFPIFSFFNLLLDYMNKNKYYSS